MTTRREFLRASAVAGGALALGSDPLDGIDSGSGTLHARLVRGGRQSSSLRILILGGTGFIGPHQVRTALERGHEVTIFNRGRSEPGIFPEIFADVEQLVGDRAGDLSALEGSREWDAVLDNSATDPGWVRDTTELLRGRTRAYLFISSVGVFYPYRVVGAHEGTPLHYEMADPDDGSEEYAVQKARSERVLRNAFPVEHIVVRPTFVAGPGDPTDRYTYWPVRLHRGGDFLAPSDGTNPVQYIDVRDLTRFMIDLVERRAYGIYNAVGPGPGVYSVRDLVRDISSVVESDATPVWVDTDALLERDVRYMIPWIAPEGDTLGMTRVDGRKAVAAGLRHTPPVETARDTLEWFLTLPAERRSELRAGLSPQREEELLAELG